MRFFEDIEIGQRRELGSFTFTADAIKKFAAQFDPQRFHLDEEEGRKSLFGGLAASGWHVGSVCMKLLVADGQRAAQEALARGEKIAIWGPSPGFRDLRWIKPVLAGDTISFASEVEIKAHVREAPRMGHRAGPQHRHQPARRTGVLAAGDRLRAAAEQPALARRPGTIFSLTHFEPSACHDRHRDRGEGMTMADRNGLRFVGFIFATVTVAVMLATGMVVKGYADGAYSLETTSIASR